MDKPMMRLFVWPEFAPDYTSGLAFALAETVQQAQKMVIKQLGYNPPDWGLCEEHGLEVPFARSVSGGG